jgi:hypothetical protein
MQPGHARRCIKSTVRTVVVSLDIRWLDLMPKHAFFYPSRVTCAKTISPGCHCICRLVNPSACIYHRNRLLTYRVQAVFSGNGRALYVPYVPCPWASNIFCQTTPCPGRHLAYHCSSRSFVKVSWMSAQLYSEPSSVRPL